MANYEKVTIECNDNEVMDYLKKLYRNNPALRIEGDGISITNRQGITHHDLMGVSYDFQGKEITAVYAFESDHFEQSHEISYMNGEYFEGYASDEN